MELLDDSFAKKRRNLLLATSVLLFLKYADAEVQSSTSISMLKFTIGNPEAITRAIWIVWGYCVIRAYQHFSYYLKKEYHRSRQKTVVPLMHPYVSGVGVPLEREMFFFEDLERFHNYDLTFRPQFILESLWNDWKALVRVLRRKFRPPTARRINLLRYGYGNSKRRCSRVSVGDAWRICIWTITDRSIVGAGKLPIEIAAEVGLDFFSGLFLRTRMLIALVLRSAPFFEMRLPFIYAITPLLYYGYEPMVIWMGEVVR